MRTVNDGPGQALYLEEAYRKITQSDDDVDIAKTPPSDVCLKSAAGPPLHKKGSIIDLTTASSGDEGSGPKKIRIADKREECRTIKQEERLVIPKVKGKALATPAQGDSRNVVAKTYRHGDGKVTGKAAATEEVLGVVAKHLSPESQEKRELARMDLFRELRAQDRFDRVFEEKEKIIDDLKKENNLLHERTTAAETSLNIFSNFNFPPTAHYLYPAGTPSTYSPFHATNITTPAFTDPNQYVVLAATRDNNELEPEKVASDSGLGTVKDASDVAEAESHEGCRAEQK